MTYVRNRHPNRKGLELAAKVKKIIQSIQAQNYLQVDGYGIIYETSADPDLG